MHHGERRWGRSPDLGALVGPPPIGSALGDLLPRWMFVIDDLRDLSDLALLARALPPAATLTLAALRDSRSLGDVTTWLERWADLIRRIFAIERSPAAYLAVVRYLFFVDPDLDVAAARRTGETIALGAGEPFMSTAQKLIEQGIEQGIERGIEKGQRAMLRRLIELRFGPLSETALHRLASAQASDLARWADRVLTATSVEEALG